jgi:membrane-associated phospholipid phosphatase
MTVAVASDEARGAILNGSPGGAAAADGRAFLSRHRWLALWMVALVAFMLLVGLPTSRTQIFVFTTLGIIAVGAGTTSTTWKRVLRDWVPFYLALTVYDSLRGAANNWLMPHALPQIHFDRAVFGGEVPTVQLQHALYTPGVAHVWDYAAFGVYMTHFIVPFVIAGVLWHFNHERFRRFTFLFLTLTFSAFITYALYPAVPPWLAAQNEQIQPTAKIIDEMWAHIGVANGSSVFSATGHFANPVAAVPSLHAAYPMLIMLFFWPLVRRPWRVLLALYPLAMGFTLVYTGEHYVIDVLLGWLYAAAIYGVGSWAYRRWRERHPARDVEDGVEHQVERAAAPSAAAAV